jgi:competence protein ComEC
LVPFRAKNLEITFMDVGQGDGIFLKLPDGTNMLIDGGSSDVKNLGKYRLEPFLKYKGVKNIDYAVITHGDSDHYSGILEFLQADYKGDIRIRNLVLPNVSFTGDSYLDLIKAAKEKGVKVSVLSRGNTMKNANVYLNCLWPDKELLQALGEASDTNSHSIVLSLHFLDFDLLLTGDLEGMGEKIVTEEIEEEKGRGGIIPLRYDILKVAHHGSKYSTSNKFLEAAAPALAIISSGMDNSYGHPHKETLDRLTINKSAILQTKECGAVTVFTNGRQIKILEYNR